jgi:UDP-N-acetylglucosamine 1-carboxyvinyltransferase
MSNSIKVFGGNPLNGVVTPIPNKNAILKIIPAALLSEQTTICKNFPDTTDVEKMLEIAKRLGATVEKEGSDIKISSNNLQTSNIDEDLGGKVRTSIMFVGPLLHRFGHVKVPMPGGCTLGKRSIAAHIEVFTKAGVEIEYGDMHVTFKKPTNSRTEPLTIWQTETSVTATENIIMYLASLTAETTLINAACEPHVEQLCKFLVSMGADIQGIGSNKLTIKDNSNLRGTTFIPEPDHVDIGGFIVAAAITRGKITVKDAAPIHISGGLINVFSKFGILITTVGNDLHIDGTKDLEIDLINSGFPMADEDLPKLNPGPWPNFPVDVLPVVVPLACKTKGRLLINNWMYESGLQFVYNLKALGALIDVIDGQKIIVHGPSKFKSGEVTVPEVIQACKAVFLASLADNAEIIIHGTDILKRRYPDIFNVYRSLGAKIEIL